MKIAHGKVTTRPTDGQRGAAIFVDLDEGGYRSRQQLHTHGLTVAAAVAEIEGLAEWHRQWATVQDRLSSVVGTTLEVGNEVYRIADCTVPSDRPYDDVELILGVWRFDQDSGERRRIAGWPRSVWYESISDIPPNAAIIATVRAFLESRAEAADAHRDYTGRVGRLLDDQQAERGRRGGG